MVFERLWKETGCSKVINKLLAKRGFAFPVERAIFCEVLHRLACPGSDRSAVQWRQAYRIEGVEDLDLHHAYRAMACLGELIEEPRPEQAEECLRQGATSLVGNRGYRKYLSAKGRSPWHRRQGFRAACVALPPTLRQVS